MIERISSTLSTFKTLVFHKGLNILLADRTPTSTDRQTRNSAGKSSLIEIIHFLTGGNMSKGSIFSEPPLREHSFTMVFNPGVNQSLVTVERYGNEPSKIWLQGDYSEWIIKPSMQDLHQRFGLSNEDWKRILGHLMFGLLPKDDLLKFRTIFPYFIRRQQDGAFLDFTKHHQSES